MRENSKTTYYVINHKDEVIGVVTGGRGIKKYLQEHDAHAVGNGVHRINTGDIVYFIGGDYLYAYCTK